MTIIKCDCCGKQFYRKPSEIGENNYCSMKCRIGMIKGNYRT